MPDATSAHPTSGANTSEIQGASGNKGEHVFKHAPPKPAGDPWDTILRSELEADTERCNAWKEEVQNLLIFAGLFSAVVTAFVIESYKFLQPDPNTVVVSLLYHIAATSNNSLPFPPSVNPASINAPFSSTSSSVRINVFWFLSLILSLTTVLVGTISLQWLREHQSYPNFTPKEKVAILHMRLEAFDAWYVPQIFAGLPLLLQAALVLFLAGMIDFALPLGVQLAVPVAVVIGLTLLFLGCTTTLPALQCLSFFVRDLVYPRKTVPTPCAFKSPQSQAFRVLVGLVLNTIFYIFPKLAFPSRYHQNPWPPALRHLAPSIYRLWDKANWRSWPMFDREWLSFRDACHHRICDKDKHLFEHRQRWAEEFPLSDVTQALVKIPKETHTAKHTNEFLEAAAYCFEELSKSVWTNQRVHWAISDQRIDRRSNYFKQLLGQSLCPLSEWLIHGGVYKFDHLDQGKIYYYITDEKTILFHYDEIFYFLQSLLKVHSSSSLTQYSAELWAYIMKKLGIQPLQSIQTPTSIPNVLEVDIPSMISSMDSNATKYSTVANMLEEIFKIAASYRILQEQLLHILYMPPTIPTVLEVLAYYYDYYLGWKCSTNTPNNPEKQQFEEIDNQYTSIFKFVTEHLNNERATISNPEGTQSALFYLAAIFTYRFLQWQLTLSEQNSNFGQGLRSLLEALLQYRTWILKSGRKNTVLEEQFGDDGDNFSEGWWDKLFQWGREVGIDVSDEGEIHRMTVLECYSTSGTEVILNEEQQSQEMEDQANETNVVAAPSSRSIPADPDTEASNATSLNCEISMATDPKLEAAHPIPSPPTVDPAPTPNVHPDSINASSKPLPRLTSVQPDEIRAAADEGLEESPSENVAPSILAETAEPPVSVSSVADSGLSPGQNIGFGEPHVAIDVERPGDNAEDIDAGGAAGAAGLDPAKPEGEHHVAIDVGIVGDMEVKERFESAGVDVGLSQGDPDAEDDTGGIELANASVGEGSA